MSRRITRFTLVLLAQYFLVISYSQAQPFSGLVLHYSSDSVTGILQGHVPVWQDVSGHGSDAIQTDVIAQPLYVPAVGLSHGAVIFPGTAFLRAPSVFPVHRSYTLSVVIHATNFSLITNLVSGDNHALWLENSRYPRVLHNDPHSQAISAIPLWSDSINLVVVRYSDDSHQAKLYVNGGFADSMYVGRNEDSTLYIGAFLGTNCMQGEMYDVQLYDRELSLDELERLTADLLHEYSIKPADPRPAVDTTFSEIPRHLQLYPRDTHDSATVSFSGRLPKPDVDSVVLLTFKDNGLIGTSVCPAHYVEGSVLFHLTSTIHAELSEYSFEVHAFSHGSDSLVRRVDSVVAGDAFVVDGQSNAIFGYDDLVYKNEYARTFGIDRSQNYCDTLWAPAIASKWGDGTSVGAWAQRIERDYVDRLHIPVCCINGGVSATNIQMHEPDSANRMDLRTYYGEFLFRCRKAGLDSAIRFMIWDQGELNYADHYHEYFTHLHDAWKQDLPSLRKVYVLQNRPNFCGWGNIDLRNVQWHLQDSFPDVETISTAGLPGHDGCHYTDSGMVAKGDRLFRSISRDFYGDSDTAGLRSPFLEHARYSNSAHTAIDLVFVSNSDMSVTPEVTVEGMRRTLAEHLYLDDLTGVREVSVQGNVLTCHLEHPSNAGYITYLPDQFYNNTSTIYEGPWIVNTEGASALLFYHYPIDSPQAVSDPKIPLFSHSGAVDGALRVSRTENAASEIIVSDLLGRVVLRKTWRATEPDLVSLSTASFADGPYFLAIQQDDRVNTSAFVVVHK